jgi:EAL domain-containing protein (putative c-di-GMP-specific phosphodiesterase class I)
MVRIPALAAGVDDEAHREILSQLGIDFLQGKIFADMVLLNQNT